MANGPGGRPTKLTQDIQDKITLCIRGGNYAETAAAYAGIHKSTFYDWLKRGEREIQRLLNDPKAKPRKAEASFVEFSDAVEKAMTEAEMRDVAVIMAARDWKAAAWHLERRQPQKWGRSDKLQLEGSLEHEHKGEVEVNHNLFTDIDQYAEVLRKAAERQAEHGE
jgi:transposase